VLEPCAAAAPPLRCAPCRSSSSPALLRSLSSVSTSSLDGPSIGRKREEAEDGKELVDYRNKH
jgi:hypothetical protein